MKKLFKTIDCLGYSIFNDVLNNIASDKKLLINTINQYSYCIAEKDPQFKEALKGSDILLPDGVAMVLAVRLLTSYRTKKIAGADLHQFFLEKCNAEKKTCFYLGSSSKTLTKIQKRLQREYPQLNVGFYSPPYKQRFTEEDSLKMVEAINVFKPDILFVGMTAPKQEKWAYMFRNEVNAKIICSIGAVFDFYAGTVRRPGKFWIKIGLEWLLRLVKEPKRLWRRYLYYGPFFLFLILKEKVRPKF